MLHTFKLVFCGGGGGFKFRNTLFIQNCKYLLNIHVHYSQQILILKKTIDVQYHEF